MKHIIQFLTLFIASLLTVPGYAADDQTRQTRKSSEGIYQVTIESWMKPLRLGRMHAWEARITDTSGKPVTGARIKIGGGMPIHNHGFPTEPIMTSESSPGTYVLEGFRFSMSGPWVIYLDITTDAGTDSVAFDINL